MDLAYGAADFCVGRAGATFLAEIRAKRLPVLLVPYPFADGHQRANAEVFRRECGAKVVEQEELDGQKLAMILEEMMNEARKGVRPSAPTGRWVPNARQALADALEACIKNQ